MQNYDAVEILLVEDNSRDAELTIRALKKHNLANNLLTVTDGQAALDFLFSTGDYASRTTGHNPKVILLDLKLPKVDGQEVLRRIKNDSRTSTIPVVVLTSSNEERDLIESWKLGVNSYIVKPVDFMKFVDCVASLGMYWLVLNQPLTKEPKAN